MERIIGEVFEVDGVKVQCVEDKHNKCFYECFFADADCLDIPCMDIERKDGKNVFFKELED